MTEISQEYRVLMFDGFTKSVADVKKGDALIGPDSKPRVVKRITICNGEAFEIKPNKGEFKGEFFILGGDNYVCLSKVGTQNCFLDIYVSDFQKQSKYFKSNYKLHRSDVDFDVRENPPIDAYFLGLLLGKSSFRDVSVNLMSSDNEIIKYCIEAAENMGLTSKTIRIGNSSKITFGFCHKRNNPLMKELENLGLWGKFCYEKFIPNIYKCGSKNVRLSMLAGLVDSDGNLTITNSLCYYTTSQQLADDVAFIARSLGFACSVNNPVKRQNNWNPCYVIYICGDFSKMPLLVSRKKPKPRHIKRNVLHTGFSVKKLDGPGFYCKLEFENENQHYLKSDFMVLKGGQTYEL